MDQQRTKENENKWIKFLSSIKPVATGGAGPTSFNIKEGNIQYLACEIARLQCPIQITSIYKNLILINHAVHGLLK